MANVLTLKIDVANRGHFTNTYILYSEKQNAILIDPAHNPKYILDELNKKGLTLKYIVITHAHADHIGALEEILKQTKATVYIKTEDKEALFSRAECYYDLLGVNRQNISEDRVKLLHDEQVIALDDISLEVIHTPRTYKGIYLFI